MKTFTAIALNIVYPGAGYLYLKDDFRKTIAKFLVFVWTLFIATILYMLVEALISGNFYRFNLVGDGTVENPGAQVPFLAIAMWGFMVYDTFKLSRSLESKNIRRFKKPTP